MKVSGIQVALLAAGLAGASSTSLRADQILSSLQTNYAGQYARIYTSAATQAVGAAVTTWNNGSQSQTVPAYDGIQEIYCSSNWVYLRTTGLAAYTMGPWSVGFPNLPANQKALYRIPRSVTVPATRTATGGGAIGYFVDGVAMFNSWDAFTWNGSSDAANYNGYWNRDAYVNEGATFDLGYAHQQNTGTYHYHADPIGLRYLLGDHVDFNSTTKIFSESSNAVTKHSPILGWVADGSPVYGPYSYSDPSNAASGVRRMVSGYVIRNGQYGTSNLTANGRSTIPAWAVRLYNVSSNQSGPAVSSSYPLGRYMEDNDYLGDLGHTQGVDFDLDEYNGRYCVTPEYPNGVYAYFVAISSNNVPVFPYNIGRGYHGSPTGGSVSMISETVTTNFLGYTNLVPRLAKPLVQNGTVTLTWSALEGGSYTVVATPDLVTWSNLATNVAPTFNVGSYQESAGSGLRCYQVEQTALAGYDSAGTTVFTGGGSSSVAPGGSASRGTTVNVTITLPTMPPWPPANAPISSVTLAGSVGGVGISDAAQGTVQASFVIPSNAPTGAQNVVIVFNMGPTYTLTGGFTIN